MGSVWPLAARAQQGGGCGALACSCLSPRTIRIAGPARGIPARVGGFGLDRGPQRAVRLPVGRRDADRIGRYATELVALVPDVILAWHPAMTPLLRATRTVPIVFANLADPVGAGFVESLARPGGNVTGFTLFEYGLAGNGWSYSRGRPDVTRAAVIRDPARCSGAGQLGAIEPWRRHSGWT